MSCFSGRKLQNMSSSAHSSLKSLRVLLGVGGGKGRTEKAADRAVAPAPGSQRVTPLGLPQGHPSLCHHPGFALLSVLPSAQR